MIKESVIKKIETEINREAKKLGLDYHFVVKSYIDDECSIRIPKDIAMTKNDAVEKLYDTVKKLPEIESIYDRGRGEKLIGDDFRAFEIVVSDGCWYHTEKDEELEEDEMRQYFDMEYAQKKKKEMQKERLKHWRDYILPLPEKTDNQNDEIFLTMAYEPYDLIEKGEKKTEFRAYTENYNKKLLSHPLKYVKFQRGYGGPGRGKPKQMTFEIKKISLYDVETRSECSPHNLKPIVPTHFAIDLGKRVK